MKNTFSNRIAIVTLGVVCFFIGCSMSADMGKHKGHNPPPIVAAVKHLISGAFSSSHIVPAGTGHLIASDEDNDGVVFAQAPTPLAQSFDAICNNGLDFSLVPAGNFVPIPLSKAGVSECISFASQIQGGGKRIHDTALLNTLVVDITLDDGSELTCEDRINTQSVVDGSVVQAYFIPSTGQTIIANGTLATTLACSVVIPQGRTVKQLEAQWTKG